MCYLKLSRKLETLDDFDDDAVDINAYRVSSNGNPSLSNSTKLSQLVTKAKKAKVWFCIQRVPFSSFIQYNVFPHL